MTPNARKNAARAYQRQHHVPYTEALRAVTTTAAHALDDANPHGDPLSRADRRLLDALQITDPAAMTWPASWRQHATDHDLTVPIATPIDEPTTATLQLNSANSVTAVLGVPGAGKTAALRTITLALCALYPPERVTFACAGGKWGFLHSITALPHLATQCFDRWDYRDDVHPDVARWCAYLDAEIDSRTATSPKRDREPELVVVIDDLDEFLDFNPAAATTVQRIIDHGRDLGIHLIVSLKQLHTTDRWTVPVPGRPHETVRFRPDTVIAFHTFRREESMLALGHPGAWSLAPGLGHAHIAPPTALGDTPVHILTVLDDDAAALSRQIAADQQ